jgi:precorrin-6Y C5,15-methyltransferase (decarboxylating)
MTAWLSILGIGEDGVEGLSPDARARLARATLVVGGARHLSLASSLITGERLAWPSPMDSAYPTLLARRGEPVVVLASGDPFCHGIGAVLARLVPIAQITCLPAPSAFSLACARLGWPLHDTGLVSLCGHPLALLRPRLQPGGRLLVLSADATTPAQVAALLRETGFGASVLHILEALGGPHERHRRSLAEQPLPDDIAPLNLLAIELVAAPNAPVLPLAPGLADDLFAHDGQITKREIRAVTLSSLAPRRGELLWDIGCGSGSIAIEWRLRHPSNRAIGIEPHAARAARARANAERLGAPGLRIIEAAAPDALADLPTPDAVFLGGGARRQGVIATAWQALRPGGRIVANAVTLETETALVAAHAAHGGTLTRLAVERLDRIGDLHGFRPAMTVTQWAAEKP